MFTPPPYEFVVEAEALAAASEAVAALDLRPKFDVTTSAAVALWIHRRPSRNGIFYALGNKNLENGEREGEHILACLAAWLHRVILQY